MRFSPDLAHLRSSLAQAVKRSACNRFLVLLTRSSPMYAIGLRRESRAVIITFTFTVRMKLEAG